METLHKPEHSLQSGKNFNKSHNPKSIHHKWGFWLGMVLIMVAVAIYIMSENLSIQPKPATVESIH